MTQQEIEKLKHSDDIHELRSLLHYCTKIPCWHCNKSDKVVQKVISIIQQREQAAEQRAYDWMLLQTEVDTGSSKVAYMNQLRQLILKRRKELSTPTPKEGDIAC